MLLRSYVNCVSPRSSSSGNDKTLNVNALVLFNRISLGFKFFCKYLKSECLLNDVEVTFVI